MNIKEALQIIKPAIPPKPSIPSLSGALVKNGWICGYDLSIAILAKVDLPDMVIPQKAMELILANDDVTLTYSGSSISVTFGKAKSKFVTFPLDEYPELPKIENTEESTLNAEDLNGSIQKVMHSTAKTEAKPVHMGIKLKDGQAIAIDGIRLSVVEFPHSCDVIIPPVAFNALKGFKCGKISVSKTTSHIVFKSDDISVISRTLSGEFLDHNKVLPKDYSFFKVDKSKLSEIVKNVMIFQTEKVKKPCEILISDGTMKVSVSSPQSEYVDELEANTSINLKIGVNPQYLSEALKSIDGDIEIGVESAVKPILIKGKNHLEMILPVRLTNG